MATVAEMQMLNDSLGDLTRTLLQRRAMRQQASESAAKQTLAERMATLNEREAVSKEADYADQRANRKLALEGQTAERADFADYRKQMLSAKTEGEKMQIWQDMLKSGAMTPQALDAMGKAMSDKLGVEVKLAMPVNPEPQSKNTPGGREVTWMPGGREAHVGQAPLGPQETIEYDPVTGEPRNRTVRGPLGTLNPAVAPAEPPTDEGIPVPGNNRGGGRSMTLMGAINQPASRASFVRDAMKEIESGAAQPAWGPPPGLVSAVPSLIRPGPGAAPAPVTTAAPGGMPPKPADKTDAQILREAADAIERNPAAAETVRARLQAWGLLPAGK